jgi:septum formation protein
MHSERDRRSVRAPGATLAPLVLGSTSRYRRELLTRLGLPFGVDAPGIDEAALPGEAPRQTALRLAEAKAHAVAQRHPHALVIGSDQVAELDGRAIGKPADHADAVRQLRAASGRTLDFHTGVALVHAASSRCRTRMVTVSSTFRVLSDADIECYLAREAPYDCAGSVKAEGFGIALFERIESGDPTALVGLPLIAVVSLLREEGVDVLAGARP